MRPDETRSLLRRAERNIREGLFNHIPAKRLDEIVAGADTDRQGFYVQDGGPLTFSERQGILAIITIRSALSCLPPPRAIVLPEDSERATLASEAFMAGMLYGFSFPEQLREKEEPLVKHGLKFDKTGSTREHQADALEKVLHRIAVKFQKKERRFPSIAEVLAALEEMAAPGGSIEEVDGGGVTWVDAKGDLRDTSIKTIKGRLTKLRREIKLID
ncbi:MAG TPA: hypothetical protein DCZ75_06415 [Geobacter sp.]|nr:hypothetical protein [Geobacter sp.]